jgi:AraC family transcriptional regulator
VLGGNSLVAHLYVDPAQLTQAAAARNLPPPRLRDFFAEQDDALAGLMRWLLAATEPLDVLAREQLQALLHRHLLDRYLHEGVAPRPPARDTLTGATLRRVFAHIESALCEPLSLSALAQLARLSPDHFLRAFKSAVGQTPHQYVIDRRIARARQLMNNRNLTLLQVATETGFCSASHFAAAFRQRTGMSPRRWRSIQ